MPESNTEKPREAPLIKLDSGTAEIIAKAVTRELAGQCPYGVTREEADAVRMTVKITRSNWFKILQTTLILLTLTAIGWGVVVMLGHAAQKLKAP